MWGMMAMLRRFIALLLTRPIQSRPRLEHDLTGKPGPTFPDHAQKNLKFAGRSPPQKGSPAKRTGHTLRVAQQHSQKTPKINDLLPDWLTDFRLKRRPQPAVSRFFAGIDPAQHFLEVVFDGFVTKTGPQPEGVRIPDQDRAAAGFQPALGLEHLDDPAGVAAADPQQRC